MVASCEDTAPAPPEGGDAGAILPAQPGSIVCGEEPDFIEGGIRQTAQQRVVATLVRFAVTRRDCEDRLAPRVLERSEVIPQ